MQRNFWNCIIQLHNSILRTIMENKHKERQVNILLFKTKWNGPHGAAGHNIVFNRIYKLGNLYNVYLFRGIF